MQEQFFLAIYRYQDALQVNIELMINYLEARHILQPLTYTSTLTQKVANYIFG